MEWKNIETNYANGNDNVLGCRVKCLMVLAIEAGLGRLETQPMEEQIHSLSLTDLPKTPWKNLGEKLLSNRY